MSLDINEYAELRRLLKLFGFEISALGIIKRVGRPITGANPALFQKLQQLAAAGNYLQSLAKALQTPMPPAPTPPTPVVPPKPVTPPPSPPMPSPWKNSPVIPNYFSSPDQQIRQFRQWNGRRSWGFTDKQISVAISQMPTWPSGLLTCLVLVPYFVDSWATFRTLWDLAGSFHDKQYLATVFNDPSNLALRHGARSARNLLRWETIDLGCNRDNSPRAFSDASVLPHAGILAAAAHHPDWVRSIDAVSVPFVWLSGYIVRNPRSNNWEGAPRYLFLRDSCRQSTVRLVYEDYDKSHPSVAVPQFRRLP